MQQNEKILELTWKDVFDTTKKMYGHIFIKKLLDER